HVCGCRFERCGLSACAHQIHVTAGYPTDSGQRFYRPISPRVLLPTLLIHGCSYVIQRRFSAPYRAEKSVLPADPFAQQTPTSASAPETGRLNHAECHLLPWEIKNAAH